MGECNHLTVTGKGKAKGIRRRRPVGGLESDQGSGGPDGHASRVAEVRFWASWCPNCKAEHAESEWHEFTAANPGVEVIFISVWGSADGAIRLLHGYGLAALRAEIRMTKLE